MDRLEDDAAKEYEETLECVKQDMEEYDNVSLINPRDRGHI
jgi:hypothetical protein